MRQLNHIHTFTFTAPCGAENMKQLIWNWNRSGGPAEVSRHLYLKVSVDLTHKVSGNLAHKVSSDLE